ncbi:hypothetical protein LJR220_006647 [Bradyrhizobium sp. LjRoot220]|uniref:hypothetical protein n=1 Tax=Bradyrhizobium sp. LjRoot220 TaxID=3342284 RepID=UPI003ECD67D7
MSISRGKLGLAIVLAALCLGGRAAHAQAAPVPYWGSGWPIGFGGALPADQNSDGSSNLPGFDGIAAPGTRTNFSNGMFIGGTSSSAGVGWNGINQSGAFGHFGPLRYEGMQAGYNFGSAGGLPITVYAGFDSLKYDGGAGGPFAPFDTKPGTLPGYRAHAGVEFQPAPNVSLSLGFGFTQQSGGLPVDSEIHSLPGASSIIPSGRR